LTLTACFIVASILELISRVALDIYKGFLTVLAVKGVTPYEDGLRKNPVWVLLNLEVGLPGRSRSGETDCTPGLRGYEY
jgi:hypothetical protein